MTTKRKSERLICGSCLARVTITNGRGRCKCGREYTLDVGKAKKTSSTRKKGRRRFFRVSKKTEAFVINLVLTVGTMAVIIIILAKWGG